MSIRILGGQAKGMELSVPKGDRIRPTSVLLRRKIYDSFQNDLPEILIDAFAGTGSVGLEGLSRGIPTVYLIEKDSLVYKLLKSNSDKINTILNRKANCTKSAFEKWLPQLKMLYEKYSLDTQKNTVIYFDPPYDKHDLYLDFLDKNFFEQDWFKGQLWIESDKNKGIKKEYWDEKFKKDLKKFEHSDSYISIIDFDNA